MAAASRRKLISSLLLVSSRRLQSPWRPGPSSSKPAFRLSFDQTNPVPFYSSCTPNRWFSASAADADYSAELDDINSKFAEAREEIEMAMESKETVYFDEEAQTARDAVQAVLDKYKGLLSKLPDDEKGSVQRSMGLKMEQLKAELEQLNH